MFYNYNNYPNNLPPNNGYITIFSVIVLGAIGTAIITALALTSVRAIRTNTIFYQTNQAKGLANACVETALQQVNDLPSFNGTGNLSVGNGNCTYTVTDLGGENKKITSIGTVNSVIRKVKVEIDQINPQINIVSWQEVADL